MRTRMLAGALGTAAVVTLGVAVQDPSSEQPATADAPPASSAPPEVGAGDTGSGDEQAAPESRPRTQQATRVFDTTARSTTAARSPWVIVNKQHPIRPADFRPDLAIVRGYQVAQPAAPSLRALLVASDRAGLGLKLASAFRSYAYQQLVYGNVVASMGSEQADQLSARPGYSEHQTGLAVDVITPASPACDFDACFATTPAGRWLAAHAWEHGFVLRYQPGTEAITGYSAEPWHLRYVGRDLAAELRRTDTATLERFFGVSGGDYR